MEIAMIRTLAAALVLAALPLAAHAQTPQRPPVARPAEPDLAAQRAAIAKLDWMVGAWEGAGWVDMGGGRQTFRQTEAIERRLGDSLLLIEGRGYAGTPETMAFNAVALVSFNDRTGKYNFRSHTRGYVTDATAEFMPDGSFRWTMTPPGMTIRYTITQPRPGAWNEVGERSSDAGATWTKFFEMNLMKKP